MPKPLYIEALIRTDMAKLWRRTQDPAEHQRWDARFTEIDYIGVTTPQRFRYSTTVFGVRIHGEGITSHKREATSALRFRSDHPLSMIVSGSGYWRYIPTHQGIRFLTGYDYVPQWAPADRVFRPLMGWATAWSFDRLRIWLEHDIPPEKTRAFAVVDAAIRAIAIVAAVRTKNPWLALIAFVPKSDKVPAARRCLRKRPLR
ncbi:hypothetical protein DMH04_25430 [Kibdelosporangium aridum]|uniref:SRPBCC family protein n=1 Tax=Kibdelosporangium aridum TaxID=2030 RepID=A0A428Z633_KIBAR|nr:hypothetical protein [Kibdelosporangium aridum]RSM82540.1 hypothetical protein DMH04_25430 [Kibdelosporangium aridum]